MTRVGKNARNCRKKWKIGGGECMMLSPQEAPAAASSRALICVAAVVDLFFAAAVLAGGACRSQVYVGIAGVEIL